MTFGQVKFFALQKDQNGKSVGVAFFEYNDMMTQQQARAALEGLELGAKKLTVKRPEEVLSQGLVSREQKLGNRVVASKILFLKNIVEPADLKSDASYGDICADIRLEAEKFGPVVSIEVPRSKGGGPTFHQPAGMAALTNQGPMALTDGSAADDAPAGGLAGPKPTTTVAVPGPTPVNTMQLALVSKGQLAVPGSNVNSNDGTTSAQFDANAPGIGYAFIEFATIEGASKAKKALHGRKFGTNEVECEYFNEDKYYAKDFKDPQPNDAEPKVQVGLELALVGEAGKDGLDEAPVMAD